MWHLRLCDVRNEIWSISIVSVYLSNCMWFVLLQTRNSSYHACVWCLNLLKEILEAHSQSGGAGFEPVVPGSVVAAAAPKLAKVSTLKLFAEPAYFLFSDTPQTLRSQFLAILYARKLYNSCSTYYWIVLMVRDIVTIFSRSCSASGGERRERKIIILYFGVFLGECKMHESRRACGTADAWWRLDCRCKLVRDI
jgi:hypothetical protein